MPSLTVKTIAALKEQGMYGDGEGLYLRVGPRGGKSWVLRTLVHGKRRELGLGSASLVPLSEARELAPVSQDCPPGRRSRCSSETGNPDISGRGDTGPCQSRPDISERKTLSSLAVVTRSVRLPPFWKQTAAHDWHGRCLEHAFGLAHTYPGKPVQLLYLYWEPPNADEFPVFGQHRSEVARFADRVAGSSPSFAAMSYSELWNGWTSAGPPAWLVQNLTRLQARYSLPI